MSTTGDVAEWSRCLLLITTMHSSWVRFPPTALVFCLMLQPFLVLTYVMVRCLPSGDTAQWSRCLLLLLCRVVGSIPTLSTCFWSVKNRAKIEFEFKFLRSLKFLPFPVSVPVWYLCPFQVSVPVPVPGYRSPPFHTEALKRRTAEALRRRCAIPAWPMADAAIADGQMGSRARTKFEFLRALKFAKSRRNLDQN